MVMEAFAGRLSYFVPQWCFTELRRGSAVRQASLHNKLPFTSNTFESEKFHAEDARHIRNTAIKKESEVRGQLLRDTGVVSY